MIKLNTTFFVIRYSATEILISISVLLWMREFDDNKDKRIGKLFYRNSALHISSLLSSKVLTIATLARLSVNVTISM